MGQSPSKPPKFPPFSDLDSKEPKIVWDNVPKELEKEWGTYLCNDNVMLIGSSGVGKSLLHWRLGGNARSPVTVEKDGEMTYKTSFPTIGVDFVQRKGVVLSHGAVVRLRFWDTAGQERFRSIVGTFYGQASSILLCFNLSDRASFLEIETIWIDMMRRYTAKKLALFLVGIQLPLPIVLKQKGGSLSCFSFSISLKQLCTWKIIKEYVSVKALPAELRDFVERCAYRCVSRMEGEAMAKRIGAERYIEISSCSTPQSTIDDFSSDIALTIALEKGLL